MKITETIERECCDTRKDLKRMPTPRGVKNEYYFCLHCGMQYVKMRIYDSAGDRVWHWEPVPPPWS